MQVLILTTNTDPRRQVRYLGPYQIAWWLRSNGYSTQVLDYIYFMTKEQRLSLLKKFITTETKIVGYAPFALLNSNQKFMHGEQLIYDILDEVKENFPWVKIVIGGVWAVNWIHFGRKKINWKIDAVFKDEAEHSFLEYCHYIFKGSTHPKFTIEHDAKIINPTQKYDIQNCSMRYEKNDFILPEESLPLELSRGCIFKCKFCQYPNIGKDKDDFNKSMESIKQSLIHNYENFGTTRYHLSDDTLNSHRERTRAFCEMVKQLPFTIEYIGYARLDLLYIWPEQQDLLPESGLVSCHFGIESFDPESCKIVGKGWGAKNNKSSLKEIRTKWGDDVIINCSMIAGLGKETEKDWQDSQEWFIQNKIHDWFYNVLSIHKSLASSEFEREYEKYGYKFINDSKVNWVSSHMTRDRANEWVNNNIKKLAGIAVPSVWNYSSHRNMGFSKQEILNSNYLDLSQIRVKNRMTEKLIEKYYKLAMEY